MSYKNLGLAMLVYGVSGAAMAASVSALAPTRQVAAANSPTSAPSVKSGGVATVTLDLNDQPPPRPPNRPPNRPPSRS